MDFLSSIWNGLQDGLEQVLRMYEGLLEPVAGQYAWGISIILLTLTVRLFLVPLAIRQTKSMRAMQKLQPQLKKIQKKYEVDRSLMKTDPEKYKAMKEKQREAQMALYQEHQVNPVGGCLPLILQMPIFFALFRILQSDGAGSRLPELTDAPFLGIDSLAGTAAAGAGIGAIALVLLQVVTTYYSTRQMQGRNTAGAEQQQQAQKLMLYVMPVFLGWLSFTFPIGVVLYWVTTNFWTIGQQALIFRQVEAEEAREQERREEVRNEKRARRRERMEGGSSSKSGSGRSGSDKSGSGKPGSSTRSGPSPEAKRGQPKGRDSAKSDGDSKGRAAPNGSTPAEDAASSGNGSPGNGSPGKGSSQSRSQRRAKKS